MKHLKKFTDSAIKSKLKNLKGTSMTSTLGNQLRHSPEISSLLDNLVEQVLTYSQRITGVKDADAGLEAQSQKEIQGIGAARSRPLFYNYVGSGIGRGLTLNSKTAA